MVERYKGVPNKKRKVYADESGNLQMLGPDAGASNRFMLAASGTISSDGLVILSGTQYKTDSYVVASYATSSAPSAILYVQRGDGTLTITGDASTDFFYIVVNQSA